MVLQNDQATTSSTHCISSFSLRKDNFSMGLSIHASFTNKQIFKINEEFLNILTVEYQKLIDLKEATDKSTIVVGGFNASLSIDRTSRQKMSKAIDNIYRPFHPTRAGYTFLQLHMKLSPR